MIQFYLKGAEKFNEEVASQVNAAFRRGKTSIPILKFPPNFMHLTEDYNAEIKGQVTHFCNGPGLFAVKLLQVYNSQANWVRNRSREKENLYYFQCYLSESISNPAGKTYYGTMRKHMNKYYEAKSENIPKLRNEAIYVGRFCVARIGTDTF